METRFSLESVGGSETFDTLNAHPWSDASDMETLQTATSWLESQSDRMLEELIELCDINSSSDNPIGLERVAQWLEDRMEDLGVSCMRHPLEPRKSMDDFGILHEVESAPALQWTSENRQGRRILLAIHYDTVYPIDHPFQSCIRTGNDQLRGPGVIDAKGGIIVLRWAILAGLRFGLLDRIRWSILLNPDEEIGSPSTASLWKQLAPQFDFAMLFEPAMADGSLVDARKGSGNFLWLVRGRSAHSGRNFEAGRNAVVRTSRLAQALHDLNGQRKGVTVNVGAMHGGGPVNVVPDLCALRVNVRVENNEQMDWVERQMDRLRAEFLEEKGDFECHLDGRFSSPPKAKDASTQYWIGVVERAAEGVKQSLRWKQSGGASDGNKLSALGLPNIDTFGPEGDALHSPNEWLKISSLVKKSILTLATLVEISKIDQ